MAAAVGTGTLPPSLALRAFRDVAPLDLARLASRAGPCSFLWDWAAPGRGTAAPTAPSLCVALEQLIPLERD